MRHRVLRSNSRSGVGFLDSGRSNTSSILSTIQEVIAIRLQQQLYCLIRVEGPAVAHEGDEAVKGPDRNPQQSSGADGLNLNSFGQREGGAVPDGVEDDVGDRVQGAVAVPGLEHAVVVAREQLVLG